MHFSFFLGLSPFWWEGDAAGQGWVKWTRAGYSRETLPSLPLRGDLGFFPGFTAANSLQVLTLLKAELQMHFILWGPSQLIALSYSKCSLQLLQSCLSPLQVLFFWWKAGDNKKKEILTPNFYFQCRSDTCQTIEPETLSVQAFPRWLFSKEHQLLPEDWRGQQRP